MNEWIKVSDRLPEHSLDDTRTIEVLVFFADGIETGFYDFKHKSWYIDDARDSITSITHWMYLPEKPTLNEEFVRTQILDNGKYRL